MKLGYKILPVLFALAWLLLLTDYAFAAQVQTGKYIGASSLTTANVSFSATTTAHDFYIIESGDNSSNGQRITGIVDSEGNTWHRAATTTEASFQSAEFWYVYNSVGGKIDNATVTYSPAVSPSILMLEYSGVQTSTDPLDQKKGASATSGTSLNSSSTGVTTSTNEIVFGGAAINSATAGILSKGTGYGNVQTSTPSTGGSQLLFEDKTVSVTSTYVATATSSLSGHWNMLISTFILQPVITPSSTFRRPPMIIASE